MSEPFTIYSLQFTVHLLFSVNNERITDNVRKIDNGEQITGGAYER